MAFTKRSVPTFTPQKDDILDWKSFNGGWNNLFKPTELNGNELAQADNLMLVGKGSPSMRWGSAAYNLAGSGRVRMLDAYYNSNSSTNLLLAITDSGYLTKKTNSSYTIITGASFASGLNYQSSTLGGNMYIAAASLNFIKFDGTNLIPYNGLTTTNVSVAQLSSASGLNTWSWIVTANSPVGETLGSTARSLSSLPLDLTQTSIRISWSQVSVANASTVGYSIYRGSLGNETLLATVDGQTLQYIDVGKATSNTVFPPLTDTTAGPKAKYIIRLDDRLILAGIAGDTSKILVSGRYPYHDRFSAIDGGGYVYISPNDGDDITGLGLTNIQTTTPLLIVYKKRSTHVVTFGTVTLGSFNILDLNSHVLTSSFGCTSGDTAVPVENDYFAFGTKGLYSTGQEPQFLNQIRSNEISTRIRTYVQGLSSTDFAEANAAYIDYKYVLSFPTRKETIIYDRQRLAFMGPWKTPYGITKWLRYFDSSGNETWLAGCDDGYNRQFSTAYTTDDGTTINTTLRTKKDDFKNWNMMKILKYFYILFRNVRGNVNFNVLAEDRTGNTVTIKSATITSSFTSGSSGWGIDLWGTQQWGQTDAVVTLAGDEVARYAQLFKQLRIVQIEVTTNSANSNYELLSIKATATALGPSSLPSSLKV